MPKGILYLMVLSGALFAGSVALADDVVVHHDGPGVVVPVSPPDHHVVVEHDSSGGCQTKTVHKENDEGDSKTVTKSNCD